MVEVVAPEVVSVAMIITNYGTTSLPFFSDILLALGQHSFSSGRTSNGIVYYKGPIRPTLPLRLFTVVDQNETN